MSKGLWYIVLIALIPLGILASTTTNVPALESDPCFVGPPTIIDAGMFISDISITPSGPYCPGDEVDISVSGTNLPAGETLSLYFGEEELVNPFAGQGVLIASGAVQYSCMTCPSLLGLMVNPCGSDVENEFAVAFSGCGFNVDDVIFDINNNATPNNEDISGGGQCSFMTPTSALMANLAVAQESNQNYTPYEYTKQTYRSGQHTDVAYEGWWPNEDGTFSLEPTEAATPYSSSEKATSLSGSSWGGEHSRASRIRRNGPSPR